MHLLIVEGNKRETWLERQQAGILPYHQRFEQMIEKLNADATVEVAFPADEKSELPTASQLSKYDGVLWTGSGLCVNASDSAVHRQLEFAEEIFESGVPFYGSCWGLQVATVVAGGKVGACAKGREFGITSPIQLTKPGEGHRYFKNRKSNYQALCIHSDEVVEPAPNTTVVAYNDHSAVQAAIIQYKNSEFFGVQYHPEFLAEDMHSIAVHMKEKLLSDGTFNSESDFESFISRLENSDALPAEISNYSLHTLDVKNWLDSLPA